MLHLVVRTMLHRYKATRLIDNQALCCSQIDDTEVQTKTVTG